MDPRFTSRRLVAVSPSMHTPELGPDSVPVLVIRTEAIEAMT